MIKNSAYQTIYDEILKMKILDSHEHLSRVEEEWCAQPHDILRDWITTYFDCEMISAGFMRDRNEVKKFIAGPMSLKEKWKVMEPYWEACRRRIRAGAGYHRQGPVRH